MRPPKKVLLIDADELTLSTNRMALWVAGYEVTGSDEQGAIEAFTPILDFDIVIARATDRGVELASALKLIRSWVPVILLGTVKQAGMLHFADALLQRPSMAELLERVKVMSARKRGPRKGSHRKPAVSQKFTKERAA